MSIEKLKEYFSSIGKDINSVEVNENWCYCSAGFTKTAFDNILGQDLKIKLLNSPLKGDDHCRFELELDLTQII